MCHDNSYYLKKENKHTQEFQVHNDWIWCFTASVKRRERRKTISVHEDDSGHSTSNTWHCSIPHMQTEDATEPPGALLLKNISWSLLITVTPHLMLPPSQEEKKAIYTKFKTLALVFWWGFFFFSAQKYSSVSFSQTSTGKAAFQQTREWGIGNAKGFHIAWPKPSQSGPEARREPFPHQMCPIRGNLKLSPGGIQLHPWAVAVLSLVLGFFSGNAAALAT